MVYNTLYSRGDGALSWYMFLSEDLSLGLFGSKEAHIQSCSFQILSQSWTMPPGNACSPSPP